MAMEQSKRTSRNYVSDEREVCEILHNLSYLIKRYRVDLPFWGATKRRSAIKLSPSPPRHHVPEKKPSPTMPPSEADDKIQQQSVKKVVKKKTKKKLLEKLNELAQARESLTMELEKVKGHRNKLRAYNMELKAKQQEIKFKQRYPNSEPKKSTNIGIYLSQNTTPFPKLLENRQPYHPGFLNLLQQQQNLILQYPCNQTHPYSSPPGLLDLNGPDDRIFDMAYQPLDQNVQMIEDGNKAIAAEARKRRMGMVKDRKLNC